MTLCNFLPSQIKDPLELSHTVSTVGLTSETTAPKTVTESKNLSLDLENLHNNASTIFQA